MNEYVEIKKYMQDGTGTHLVVLVPKKQIIDHLRRFSTGGIVKAELRVDDGRRINAEQRKKAYATLRDISLYTGHLPEELKEIMKYDYMAATGEDYFSLSDCSVTTARLFINHLIEFCLKWDIPLQENIADRTDDIDKAMYYCIKHKKCAVCGKEAAIHPLENGTIALCYRHSEELKLKGSKDFKEKYHVYGISID